MSTRYRVGLNREALMEKLSLDSGTGVFTWLRHCGRLRAGSVAGGLDHAGYRRIALNGRQWSAHRLVWLWVHGEFPKDELDHINGIRDDNRIANLREATRSENLQNFKRAKSHSSSGMLGAFFNKRVRKWYSTIVVNGKAHYLGQFEGAELAHAAYLKAKVIHHPYQTLVGG